MLSRRGWRPDTLRAGDSVTVRGHVALSGRRDGIGEAIAILHSEWFDEARTVSTHGHQHPDPGVRVVEGHSIGWWDGYTMVVDTANFENQRSPYQIGVPSGGQKHVIERYHLAEDGAHIDLEFMLEDPEYLAEPMVHRRQLICSPQLEMYPGACDPEATRRFLISIERFGAINREPG